MSEWEKNLAEFGIDQSGGFCNLDIENFRKSDTANTGNKRKRASVPIVVREERSGGVPRHTYRIDFVQAITCADEEELTTLMHIVIDIVVRECHKDRVIGGDVETALEDLTKKWKEFCRGCTMLEQWIYRKEQEARRKIENREEEEEKKRIRKRQHTRALLLDKYSSGITGSTEETLLERETKAERQEYQELLNVFGSDLLIDIKRTPEEVYQDTKNVRIGTILCMISKSKALQRLVCVGKFYAESLGHEYHYIGIPKDSLDEFLAFTNILRNAFMTQQTSPGLFVKCIQKMVVRGGVHGFICDVLGVARKMETIRLSFCSTL